MRTKIFICLTFYMIVGYARADFQQKPSFTIARQNSSSVYVVTYMGSKTGNTTLNIRDFNKNLIVTKYLSNIKDFALPINFSSMTEGTYVIEIDNGSEKVSKELVYSNESEPTYMRILNLEDDRYLFTISHKGKENIKITIFDGTGTEVYNEDKLVDGNLAVLYNLKDVFGKPAFEITDELGRSLMLPASPSMIVVKKTLR